MDPFGAKEQNFLSQSLGSEGELSGSWRKYPALDTDSIDVSICKVKRG